MSLVFALIRQPALSQFEAVHQRLLFNKLLPLVRHLITQTSTAFTNTSPHTLIGLSYHHLMTLTKDLGSLCCTPCACMTLPIGLSQSHTGKKNQSVLALPATDPFSAPSLAACAPGCLLWLPLMLALLHEAPGTLCMYGAYGYRPSPHDAGHHNRAVTRKTKAYMRRSPLRHVDHERACPAEAEGLA